MNNKSKIYIGNISYEIDTAGLQEVFSVYGNIIDAVVIKDRESGASRGFGFVTFDNPASADKAIEMNGQELSGRALRVKPAEAKRREANQAPHVQNDYFNPAFYQREYEDSAR